MLLKSFLQLTDFYAYGSGCGTLRGTPNEEHGWKGAETNSVLASALVGTFRQKHLWLFTRESLFF